MPLLIAKPLAATESHWAFFLVEQDRAERVIMSTSSMRYPLRCACKGGSGHAGAGALWRWRSAAYGVHLLQAICTLLDDPSTLPFATARTVTAPTDCTSA